MPRGSGGRRKAPKATRRTVFVWCEGETEKVWLTGLKEALNEGEGGARLDKPNIKIRDATGSDATTRLDAAESEREDNAAAREDCYLVMDTEAHVPELLTKLNRVLDAKPGVTLVLSHLCFEVWLHRLLPEPMACNKDTADACRVSLKREWKKQNVNGRPYHKTSDRLYEDTADQLEDTLGRHHGEHRAAGPVAHETPAFTEVPTLVRVLRSLYGEDSPEPKGPKG